jgi:hypothetical protein
LLGKSQITIEFSDMVIGQSIRPFLEHAVQKYLNLKTGPRFDFFSYTQNLAN